MMLSELYQETIDDYSLWDYYHNSEYQCCHFRLESLNKTTDCRDFIIKYMNRGGKADLGINQDLYDLLPTRIKHIVSCFFIGLGIYHNVKFLQQEINQSVISRDSETKEQHFSYLWFLTVLFHDIGYTVEEKDAKMYEREEYDKYLNLIKILRKRPKGIPKVYTKEILRNYLKWRMCSHSCFDHGIIGGTKLYKCLTEFRSQIVETHHLASDQYIDRNNLYWGPELNNDFNFISWIVACHNIWFINNDKPEAHKYHCCKLDKLIIEKENYQILASEHPFLFLFLLADSIEPIKRLEGTEWFNRINIDFKEDSIILDLSRLPEIGIEKYSSCISGLDTWLTKVTTIDNNKNKLQINITNLI